MIELIQRMKEKKKLNLNLVFWNCISSNWRRSLVVKTNSVSGPTANTTEILIIEKAGESVVFISF